MTTRADLTLFAHLVRRPEGELDLGQAALLIAEAEYPGLDVARWVGELDLLGSETRRRISGHSLDGEAALRKLLAFLYDELGFRGNAEDYYDPRNSFLNEVLARRTGIPITLGLVVLEVARRAEIPARGVSFPGHFLVRGAHSRFIDPFEGRILDGAGLKALHLRTTGEEGDPDPRLLEPATKTQILVRLLNNLRGIYTARGDEARLRAVIDRLEVLAPEDAPTSRFRTIH
jgi:regulator of sirC expression with transglutaminase-like and TPR domain